MNDNKLLVEASQCGLRVVKVHFLHQEREKALGMVSRIWPALRLLDQQIRDESEGSGAQSAERTNLKENQ
jgi:hypothetical protein